MGSWGGSDSSANEFCDLRGARILFDRKEDFAVSTQQKEQHSHRDAGIHRNGFVFRPVCADSRGDHVDRSGLEPTVTDFCYDDDIGTVWVQHGQVSDNIPNQIVLQCHMARQIL